MRGAATPQHCQEGASQFPQAPQILQIRSPRAQWSVMLRIPLPEDDGFALCTASVKCGNVKMLPIPMLPISIAPAAEPPIFLINWGEAYHASMGVWGRWWLGPLPFCPHKARISQHVVLGRISSWVLKFLGIAGVWCRRFGFVLEWCYE